MESQSVFQAETQRQFFCLLNWVPEPPVEGAPPRVEERLPRGERAVEVQPRDEGGCLALAGEPVLEVEVAQRGLDQRHVGVLQRVQFCRVYVLI